jgi:[ribosomal protein S5]-alanine N-acetyltransferase
MLLLNFSPFPVLETGRLRLREFRKSDNAEVLHLRSMEAVMQYMRRPRAAALEDADLFIDNIRLATDQHLQLCWAITGKEHDELIGWIALWRIIPAHYRAEIGYALAPSQRGQGLMHEALTAVIRHSFHTIGLHSIEANTDPRNVASARLLKKLGFRMEAYFRQNQFFEGRFHDTVGYSLVNETFSNGHGTGELNQ